MADDAELLREFLEGGSEEAFRSLVERHTGMVHGAALRVVHNESMAEEVTQAVFVILARKARSLPHKPVLAGWLYRTARFVALEALRAESRRRKHTQDFADMKDAPEAVSIWNQIAPVLEEAMSRLGATDRDAVVLRFLEQRSFSEVASALAITEAAAKMRVGRALGKLRSALTRCGVVVPAAALLAALSTHGATAAPAALLTSVIASALTQPGAAKSSIAGLVKGALTIMAWNKAKIAGAAAVILLLLSGGGVAVWQWQTQSRTTAPAIMQTFEPMAGEWVGTVSLTRDGTVFTDKQPCSMSVTTQQGGRACQIELRMRLAPGSDPAVQHYAHTLNKRGDGLFTISDPPSGRGDGECQVTESFHNPAAGEWRAAMRFPLPGRRGVMEGSWERRGDTLVVRSHDEFFSPRGSSHAFADLQLRRRVGASATP